MSTRDSQTANPWTVDFDMTIEVSVPLGFRTAFKRGVKDCAAYYSEPGRGHPQKNNYSSNPYNKEGDYERWKAYNRGWNSNAF